MSTNTPSQSNPSTSTPDSWENRIDQASAILGMSSQAVETALADPQLGIEKEPAGLEMLSDEEISKFGDFRNVFPDVPIAKLRMAMKFLRGPKQNNNAGEIDPETIALKEKFGIKFKMENADPEDMLPYYHPEKPNHPVTKALKKRFGDQKVIAFKPESKQVDIEATANYMADLEQGFPSSETVDIDGTLVRLYKVGATPNQQVDEDPLFPGQPLKRERSIVNRINWANVGEETRKLCRIIVELGDLDPENRFDLREFMKLANEGIDKLQEFYPEAYLEYRERKQNGDLPKLHISLEEANGAVNNPFGVGKSNRRF